MGKISLAEVEKAIQEEATAVAEENSVNEIVSGAALLSFYRWLSPLGKIINNIDISDDSRLPPSLKNIISWTRKSNWLQTVFNLSNELKDVAEYMRKNHPTSYKTTIYPLLAVDPFANMANVTAEQVFDFWWGRMKKKIDAQNQSQKEIQATLVNALENERDELKKALEKANQALQDAQSDEKKASTSIIPAGSQEDNEKMYINEEKLKEIIKESLVETIVDKIVTEGSGPSLEVGDDDSDSSSNDDEVENIPGDTYDDEHRSSMASITEEESTQSDTNWDLVTTTRGPWVLELTGAPATERYWERNVRDANNNVVPKWGPIQSAHQITDAVRAYTIASKHDMASLRLLSDLSK